MTSYAFTRYLKLFSVAAFFFFGEDVKAQGVWTRITNAAPDRSGGGIVLLTDGTVMAKTES
ncbi:MAG: hypothetical protein ACXVPD_00960, partial [Bacteroidia bacterium]